MKRDLVKSDRKVIENAIYGTHQKFNSNEVFNLVNVINQFIDIHLEEIKELRSATYHALRKKIRFDLNTRNQKHVVSSEYKDSLDIIFKNILNNFIKGSNPSRESELIHIKIKNDVLWIKIDFVFDTYSSDYLHSYLVRPYKSNEEVHYGFFLIGMLVRHLRGVCYIKEPDKDKTTLNYTTIIIRIPIPKLITLI